MNEFLQKNSFLLTGAEKKYWRLDAEGKTPWIFYKLKSGERKEKISDPEEQVRAKFLLDLLEKYQYEAKNIEFEVRVNLGSEQKKSTDLVIYHADSEKVFAAIEFKKDGITEAEFEKSVFQSESYAKILKAEYFGSVAGNQTRFFLTKNFDRKSPAENTIADLPIKYGKPEEWRYKKGDAVWDIQPISIEELKSVLKKCQDTIWNGGQRGESESFGEVAKIIFVKIWDEKEKTKRGEFYGFQRKTNESAHDVAERIHTIYKNAKSFDPEVFNEEIKLSNGEIMTLVENLQKISLSKTDLDVKGLAFQQFLGSYFKGGAGQFFTPPPSVKFCVDCFSPELSKNHKVLDPACGSGGFLLRALDDIREKANRQFDLEDPREAAEHFNYWHGFAEKNLFGIEINESIARVAKMNMILHDDGHTNVIGNDALEIYEKFQMKNLEFKAENFDFIFTNPPFGATIRGSEKSYLGTYELAKNGKKNRDNQKTEILFIERCHDFLKKGGKMAIVLPDGILTNSSLQYVRDWILDHFQILGVVSLPQDAFRHFGAGVKSSILLLKKWEEHEDKNADYPIFMAQPEKVGIDSTGRRCHNDLDDTAKQFHDFLQDPEGFQKKKSELESVFVVWRRIVGERLDPHFFLPEFAELLDNIQKIKSKKLGELINFSSETWDQKSFFEENFPYIEISEIDTLSGEIGNISWIKIQEAPSRAKMIVKNGDIIVSTTRPNRGAIAKISEKENGFIASTGFAILRDLKNEEIDKNYLWCFLKSSYGLLQMLQRSSGGNYPAITTEELKNLKIPLPPLEIQQQIAEKMDNAFAEKKAKETEAEEILNSIEEYLLEELGIEAENGRGALQYAPTEKQMCFVISRKDLENGSFLKTPSENLKSNFELVAFEDLFLSLTNGLDNRKYQDDGEYKYITVGNIKDGEIAEEPAKFVNTNVKKGILKKSDVVITRKGSVGNSAVCDTNDKQIISSEIFLVQLIEKISPEYFSFVNNSEIIQKQYREKSTGAIMPSIAQENLKSIKIPLPPLEIQQKISSEISKRREKAKKLQKEAKAVLEMAKKEMEEMILQ